MTHFTKYGYFELEYKISTEEWAGIVWDKWYLRNFGGAQWNKWLYASFDSYIGTEIYYDDLENPFVGNYRYFELGFVIQPTDKMNLNLTYNFNDFGRKGESEKLYSVNILNFKATYQFNKYFFLRGVARYNTYQKKILTDFLASFTLIPGSVVQLGYGELYQKQRWLENQWEYKQGSYMSVKRGLFFKVSYLWRLK
ncbi:MAG: hypothetical protein GY757_29705 [bacterium]|nr:hypothetical protein [bacterium]